MDWLNSFEELRSLYPQILRKVRRVNQKKEFSHYLAIAQGSSSEVATQMLIAKRLGYVDNEQYISFYKDTDEIGRMITGLRKSINTSV